MLTFNDGINIFELSNLGLLELNEKNYNNNNVELKSYSIIKTNKKYLKNRLKNMFLRPSMILKFNILQQR